MEFQGEQAQRCPNAKAAAVCSNQTPRAGINSFTILTGGSVLMRGALQK